MRDKLKKVVSSNSTFGHRAAGAALSLLGTISGRLFFFAVAAYSAMFVMAVNARQALAQDSGAIEGALESAVDWLSGIVVVVGVLGLIVASIFWIFAGSDERKRQRATGWVASAALAIAVAFLAPSIVALLQEWTGGGGG